MQEIFPVLLLPFLWWESNTREAEGLVGYKPMNTRNTQKTKINKNKAKQAEWLKARPTKPSTLAEGAADKAERIG